MDATEGRRFTSMPPEVMNAIVSHLPNRDIKALRLASSKFLPAAQVRIPRVFLSADPRNIQVLRAIASHEILRNGVTELIWDDTAISNPCLTAALRIPRHMDPDLHLRAGLPEGYQHLTANEYAFMLACKENAIIMKQRKGRDVDTPAYLAREERLRSSMSSEASLETSIKYFISLADGEEEVRRTNADEAAFIFALERFPCLKKVTIIPSAHGNLFMPLYETPMIRDFPSTFNYPMPEAWPSTDYAGSSIHSPFPETWSPDSMTYRGFCIAVRVLGQEKQHHNITEFVLDDSLLSMGIPNSIFLKPNQEVNGLLNLITRPGFCRIDLSINVALTIDHIEVPFFSEPLYTALRGATDLEHASFTYNLPPLPLFQYQGIQEYRLTPLSKLFPVEKWPRLRHFGLSGRLVNQKELLSLISELPQTLQSIELSSLTFSQGQGSYYDLLNEIRDRMGWMDRPEGERPRLLIRITRNLPPGRYVCMVDTVQNFLYNHGPNPFCEPDDSGRERLLLGIGNVERDVFNPDHDRPHTDHEELVRLGIIYAEMFDVRKDELDQELRLHHS